MRYRYLGDRWTGADWRGVECDPVRRADGKTVVARGSALVVKADGQTAIVNRRRLRLEMGEEATPGV